MLTVPTPGCSALDMLPLCSASCKYEHEPAWLSRSISLKSPLSLAITKCCSVFNMVVQNDLICSQLDWRFAVLLLSTHQGHLVAKGATSTILLHRSEDLHF